MFIVRAIKKRIYGEPGLLDKVYSKIPSPDIQDKIHSFLGTDGLALAALHSPQRIRRYLTKHLQKVTNIKEAEAEELAKEMTDGLIQFAQTSSDLDNFRQLALHIGHKARRDFIQRERSEDVYRGTMSDFMQRGMTRSEDVYSCCSLNGLWCCGSGVLVSVTPFSFGGYFFTQMAKLTSKANGLIVQLQPTNPGISKIDFPCESGSPADYCSNPDYSDKFKSVTYDLCMPICSAINEASWDRFYGAMSIIAAGAALVCTVGALCKGDFRCEPDGTKAVPVASMLASKIFSEEDFQLLLKIAKLDPAKNKKITVGALDSKVQEEFRNLLMEWIMIKETLRDIDHIIWAPPKAPKAETPVVPTISSHTVADLSSMDFESKRTVVVPEVTYVTVADLSGESKVEAPLPRLAEIGLVNLLLRTKKECREPIPHESDIDRANELMNEIEKFMQNQVQVIVIPNRSASPS